MGNSSSASEISLSPGWRLAGVAIVAIWGAWREFACNLEREVGTGSGGW